MSNLVDFEESDKQFDLFLSDAINNLTVVTNQLRDHLRHVQPNVTLQTLIDRRLR